MRRDGLWRNASFTHLWGAATISTFGTMVTRTALPFTAILVLDASPAALSGLIVAELLPGFLFGLVAGAWVDRVRRRPVMIVSDLARALLLLTIPAAALLDALTLSHLYVAAALISVLSVFFDVAYQSYLPSLVRNDELVDANSKLSAAASVAEAAAFSSGGWLVQLLTAPFALLVDAVTFLVSALFVARIRDPETRAATGSEGDSGSILAEVREGLRAVWQTPLLRGLVVAGLGLNLSHGLIGTVILLYLNQQVGFDPGVLGMIFAVGGVSSFIGAMLAGRLPRFGIGVVMVAALLLAAAGYAFIPLATTVGLIGVALLVAQQLVSDASLTIYDINQVSLRQAITPAALLGRVNASVRVTEVGALLLGTVAAGYLGERIGLRETLWLAVGGILLSALALGLSPVRGVVRIPSMAEAAA